MAEQVCDRVAVIRDGRIVTDLPIAQLLNRYVEDRFAIEVAGTGTRVTGRLPVKTSGSPVEGSTSSNRR
jgi:ABC-2 type transport system ATP-binding protein